MVQAEPLSNAVARTNRSAQQVEEIRKRFLESYEDSPDDFEEEDVVRVKKSDWFVKRFLLARGKNVDAASQMIVRTLKWRRSMDIAMMRDWMFPIEFYKIGGLFAYEKDLQGNVVVYMRTCMHRKVTELDEFEKKFVLQVFDKVEQMTDGNGFAIVFDLTGTGYSNVDIDFLRFLIDCTSYFPVGLKYILVTNLPWILNAVRKTVMVILPESLLGLLKFASGDQIFDYIARENVPDFLGGTCRRNYRQVPQGCRPVEKLVEEFGYSEEDVKRLMPKYQDLLDKADEMLAKNDYDDVDDYFDIPTPDQQRDYSFANRLKLRMQRGEISEKEYRSQLDAIYRSYVGVIENVDKNQDDEAEQMQPDIITDLANKSTETIESNSNSSSKQTRSKSLFHVIKVTPDRLLYLENELESGEFVADVCVENNTDGFVAYKVQSNRPEAYTVSPSLGIILPRKTIRFTIRTVNGSHNQSGKDKFLVLALPVSVSQMTFDQFKALWGKNMHQSVESVRLHARLLVKDAIVTRADSPTSDFESKQQFDLLLKRCDQLQESQIKAQKTINMLLLLILFLLGLLMASATFYLLNSNALDQFWQSSDRLQLHNPNQLSESGSNAFIKRQLNKIS